MVDHLDSKNLVPFFKRSGSFRMVGMTKSRDEELLEQVDPNIRPEDEGVIRRYLNYADTLLGSPDAHGLTMVPAEGALRRTASPPEGRREKPELNQSEEQSSPADAEERAA